MSLPTTDVRPKILLIDIETTPNVVHAWGLYNQNIALSQLIEPSRMLCFSAQWLGVKPMGFFAGDGMVKQAHNMMSEADLIVHYNGNSFDIPILHSEFALAGLAPPAPSRHIDLYRVVKKNFRFPSGKLEYITKALGLEGKIKHSGHDLWVRCMEDDIHAWDIMRRYNIRDVVLLEKLYKILLPWISNHPSVALYQDKDGCRNCGSTNLRKEGYCYLVAGKYQQYQCRACNSWSRSSKRISGTGLRGVS